MQKTVESPAVAKPAATSDRLALHALVGATAISALGNGLTLLAIPWFVLVTTGSATRTGIAGAMTAVAMVVSGIFGGTMVDRLGFKRASIISDIASGVTVAAIPTLYYFDLLSFWMLLVLIFLGAVLDSPGSAARRSMVPTLVKRAGSTLERANSAMQFAQLTTGDLIAPLVAGVLIGLIGAASVLYVNTGTFVLSLLIVAFAIPGRLWKRGEAGQDAEESAEGTSYFADLKEGFRYVASDSFLMKVIPISLLVNFLVAPMFVVVLPVLANEVFESASAFGLMASGFGIGAAAGTVAYGAVGHKVKRFTIYWTALLGIAFGLGILALAPTVWVALAATIVVGIAVGPVNAVGMVIMQARVPERMMGRVFGLLNAGSGLATPAGLLAGGVVAEAFGVTTVIVIAVVGVAASGLWVLLSRSLRVLVAETEGVQAQG